MADIKGAPPKRRSRPSFAHAIQTAEHLKLVAGLNAVKKAEGRDRIRAIGTVLLGSANMDADCRRAFPNDARWDYVIGVRRARKQVAFFVEVHSAETSAVSRMAKKLEWLITFLRRDKQRELNALEREIHWVASGRVNIPRHLPQYKRLQTLRVHGLRGPVTALDLV